jgi:O-antigen ligase
MIHQKLLFKLTSFQVNLLSFGLAGVISAVLLIVGIGYRDTTVGLMILALMVASGVGAAIFLNPHWGAYILIASIFSNVSAILTEQGLPGINKPLVALVFLGIMANRFFIRRQPLTPLKRTELFLLAYGGVWLISAFVAQDRGIVLGKVVDFGKDFLIVLCIIYSLESRPGSWKNAMWLITLLVGFLAGLGAYQTITGNHTQTFFGFSKVVQAQIIKTAEDAGRLTGPIDDPNFWGQILVLVMPLAIYRVLKEKDLVLRLLAGLSAFFIAIAIIGTFSRGAFLALILSVVLIALQQRVRYSVIFVVAVTVLLVMPFLPKGFSDRMGTLTIFTSSNASVHSEVSFQGRTSELLAAVGMFSDHPILGVGAGNYVVHYQDYASRLGLERRTEDRQAHSLYLEIAAETGLLGLTVFFALITSLMVSLNQTRQQLKLLGKDEKWSPWIISLQIGIIAYLTSSIFLHGDYIRYLWLPIGMGAVIIHVVYNVIKKQELQSAARRISS